MDHKTAFSMTIELQNIVYKLYIKKNEMKIVFNV